MIIIHIGTHKTGTTAIQKFLAKERAGLLSKKVLYSNISTNHSGPLASLFKDNTFDFFYYKKHRCSKASDIMDLNKETHKTISNEIEAHVDCKIVFSGEELSFLKLSEIRRMSNFFSKFNRPIRVIVYERNREEYFLSSFQQHIKGGQSFERMIKSTPKHIFSECISLYKEVFGDKNINIRHFADAKENVIKDFLSVIDCDMQTQTIEKDNVSLGKYACFTFNAYNLLNQGKALNEKLFEGLTDKRVGFQTGWFDIFNIDEKGEGLNLVDDEVTNWQISVSSASAVKDFLNNDLNRDLLESYLVNDGNSQAFCDEYLRFLLELKERMKETCYR